jgi:SAM-dependent methyltransferase
MLAETPRERIRDILDLGCGRGESSRAIQTIFPWANVTGVDMDPYKLATGSASDNITYVHANPVIDIPFPDHSFDIVQVAFLMDDMSIISFNHVVHNSARVLRHGGVLTIVDTGRAIAAKNKGGALVREYGEYMSDKEGLQRVMLNAGFGPVVIDDLSVPGCTVLLTWKSSEPRALTPMMRGLEGPNIMRYVPPNNALTKKLQLVRLYGIILIVVALYAILFKILLSFA